MLRVKIMMLQEDISILQSPLPSFPRPEKDEKYVENLKSNLKGLENTNRKLKLEMATLKSKNGNV